jgi:uncharacterized iron-regulated membrane protein
MEFLYVLGFLAALIAMYGLYFLAFRAVWRAGTDVFKQVSDWATAPPPQSTTPPKPAGAPAPQNSRPNASHWSAGGSVAGGSDVVRFSAYDPSDSDSYTFADYDEGFDSHQDHHHEGWDVDHNPGHF